MMRGATNDMDQTGGTLFAVHIEGIIREAAAKRDTDVIVAATLAETARFGIITEAWERRMDGHLAELETLAKAGRLMPADAARYEAAHAAAWEDVNAEFREVARNVAGLTLGACYFVSRAEAVAILDSAREMLEDMAIAIGPDLRAIARHARLCALPVEDVEVEPWRDPAALARLLGLDPPTP